MPVHFTDQEMARRRSNAVRAVADAGLDALLIFKQESMYWLCGYDTFGFSLFQCLVLRADGHMALLTRLPDKRQAEYTSNLDDIRVWADSADARPQVELMTMLGDLGVLGARLGLELDSYGLKAAAWHVLEPLVTGAGSWVDASTLIDRLRAVKSAEEMVHVRRAAELADDALDEGCRLAVAGAFEGDILAAMQGAVFRGGGDYAGNEFIIGSGPAALLVRYHTGRRHLDANDQLTLEFAGAYRRYHAALMRTLLIGSASDAHRRMHAACREALAQCMSALKPGATMGEVFDAHARTMDAAGYRDQRLNACGYGMGAVYNPLWVDPPMFHPGNPLRVEVGNVFFLHMILVDAATDRAMTLGQTVAVGERGCESLSRSGLDLVVNHG